MCGMEGIRKLSTKNAFISKGSDDEIDVVRARGSEIYAWFVLLRFWLDAWRMAVTRLYCLSRRCLRRSRRFTCRVNWLMQYWIWDSKCRASCFRSPRPEWMYPMSIRISMLIGGQVVSRVSYLSHQVCVFGPLSTCSGFSDRFYQVCHQSWWMWLNIQLSSQNPKQQSKVN